jgi:PAS domain S-box-containing protein
MKESVTKSDVAPPVGDRTVVGALPDYCRIVDSVPGCILVADADGQIVYANKVALAYRGRPLDDLLGTGWLKGLDYNLINEAEKTWQRCVQRREPLNAIWRFRQNDGTYKWEHLKAEPTTDSDSAAVTWYILGVDVDEQFKAQEALLQSEQLMQRMMDTVPSMLWSMAPDGSVTFVNRKVRDYTGMSLDQIQKWGQLEMIHPEEREVADHKCQEALTNGSHCEAELRIRRADGLYRWHLVRAEPMRDENGTIVQWFAVYIDIDDQKRAEERLRELRTNVSDTSRTSMGAEISASIAHEINQPLSSVLVNAQACTRWLKVSPPKLEEAIASVRRIVRDARAVDAVMRNVRLLFKRQPAAKTPCNMVDLIQDAVSLIKEDLKRRFIPIEYDFEKPALMVLADCYQIQQVIINLLRNAIEAMQGNDRLPSLRIRILRTADGKVLTEFIDNGCGLPIQNADNIFDAFVTTKKNGMGIGLSISRTIAEAHGGQLRAENNSDFGAKFSLLLDAPESTASSD